MGHGQKFDDEPLAIQHIGIATDITDSEEEVFDIEPEHTEDNNRSFIQTKRRESRAQSIIKAVRPHSRRLSVGPVVGTSSFSPTANRRVSAVGEVEEVELVDESKSTKFSESSYFTPH